MISNDEKYNRTLTLLEQSADILEKESAILLSENIRNIETIAIEKNNIFNEFEHWRNYLLHDPMNSNAISEKQESILSTSMERFNDAMNRNQQCLKVALEMTGELFDIISDAAQQASGQVKSYSRYGQQSRLGGRTAAPVSINQVS